MNVTPIVKVTIEKGNCFVHSGSETTDVYNIYVGNHLRQGTNLQLCSECMSKVVVQAIFLSAEMEGLKNETC